MTTFIRKTLATVTLGATLLAAGPSMAGMRAGIRGNGPEVQGWSNGWANGLSRNGITRNGGQADAHALRVIGIELPSEASAR